MSKTSTKILLCVIYWYYVFICVVIRCATILQDLMIFMVF